MAQAPTMFDRKRELMRAAKRDSTRHTYDQSALNIDKTWYPEEGRWLRRTYDDLLTWLVIVRGTSGKPLASQSTVRNTVNALREEFLVNAALGRGPALTWAQNEGLSLAVTGFMRGGGTSQSVEYGPLTFDKVEKVLGQLERQSKGTLWWRVLFHYAFALRAEEGTGLRRSDFGVGENGRWLARIPLSKPRTPEQDRQLETRWCSPRAQALVAARLGRVPAGEENSPLFAEVSADQINAVIAAVAKTEKWSTQLRWSSHGFRVGSLNDAFKETGDLAEVERRGAHRSEAMKIKYSADEAARLQTTLPGGPQAAAAVRVDRRKRAKAVTHPRGVRVQVQLARRA